MPSIQISMPVELEQFVQQRALQTNHATATDYLRWLIMQDPKRADEDKLQSLLRQGLESGPARSIDDLDAYFDKKKLGLQRKTEPAVKASTS